MALIECPSGHLYDNAQFSGCPYCGTTGNRIDFGANDGKTVALSVPPSQQEIGATVAPSSYRSEFRQESDAGKTVGVFQKKEGIEPVVGWLVCTEGPEKGRDFRLRAGNNCIGRGDKMDVCLRGDASVSRENHARVVFDPKHGKFHLLPADSSNMVYLNDEPVFTPVEMKAEDVVELGKSKLVLVPFCGEKFSWTTETTGGAE